MKKIILIYSCLFFINASAQFNFQELEVNPNSNGAASPYGFVEFNGEIYFSAFNDSYGRELWKTDGTQEGTVLVKDIYTGTRFFNQNSAGPRRLTVFNGELFFTAVTENEGRELWKTDGTEEGTVIVKDILTGFGDGVTGANQPFMIFNNKMVFAGNEPGISNVFLYESDGTSEGTKPISKLLQVPFTILTELQMCIYNDSLIFQGVNLDSMEVDSGRELWITDGTENGTRIVKDIHSGSSHSYPSEMTVFNNMVYFHAEDENGEALWKTDGTAGGTSIVKDIYPQSFNDFRNYAKFTVFKNKLYFLADDGVHGREIWFSDGTESGTQLFLDINPTGDQWSVPLADGRQQTFFVFKDKLYFKATNSFDGGNIVDNLEPWESDGTVSGTKMIHDINPSGSSMSVYNYFYDYNDRLFFTTIDFNDQTLGNLYMYDLINNPIKISPENTTFTDVGTDFHRPFVFNEELYMSASFQTNNTDTGIELWKITDGTLGTEVIDEEEISIFPNPTSSFLKINLSNADVIKSIRLYNLKGQEMNFNYQNNIIDIRGFPNGVYILKATVGKRVYTQKVIKK